MSSEGSELKVWPLALPLIAVFAIHGFVGLVDMLFVAQLGPAAVTSVGIASQFYFATIAVLSVVTTGTAAVLAREWGRGNRDEASRVTWCSLALAFVVSLGLIACAAYTHVFFGLLQLEAQVVELGGDCLAILWRFSTPSALVMTLFMALRAAGDVRIPLVVGVIANLVNILLDWVLIFGRFGAPEMGARGSAYATGIAFTVGMFCLFALFLSNRLIVSSSFWHGAITLKRAWRLLRVGIPSAVEQLALHGGLILFLAIVALYGTQSIAAYQVGVRILAFCFIPGYGFAFAAGTLVGQYLGQGRPEDAEKAAWGSARACFLVMSAVGLLILIAAPQLLTWFALAGTPTGDLAHTFIWILAAAQPFMAIEFALAGALRGAGDTTYPLFVMLVGLFLLRIGSALIITSLLLGSVTAVWSCLLIDYAAKSFLITQRFRSGKWKKIQV